MLLGKNSIIGLAPPIREIIPVQPRSISVVVFKCWVLNTPIAKIRGTVWMVMSVLLVGLLMQNKQRGYSAYGTRCTISKPIIHYLRICSRYVMYVCIQMSERVLICDRGKMDD